MKHLTLVLSIIAVILVSGCVGQASELIDVEEQARNPEPFTEIRTSGFNTEMVISPTSNNVISGIVTITMSKIPAETGIVGFVLLAQGEELIGGPNLGMDGSGNDGWSFILDTTAYSNGVYTLSGIAAIAFEEGRQPLGVASAQVIIEN